MYNVHSRAPYTFLLLSFSLPLLSPRRASPFSPYSFSVSFLLLLQGMAPPGKRGRLQTVVNIISPNLAGYPGSNPPSALLGAWGNFSSPKARPSIFASGCLPLMRFLSSLSPLFCHESWKVVRSCLVSCSSWVFQVYRNPTMPFMGLFVLSAQGLGGLFLFPPKAHD